MDPLLSTDQVMALLNIGRRELESLIEADEAPPFLRIGRFRRWRRADVEAWVEARLAKSKQGRKTP